MTLVTKPKPMTFNPSIDTANLLLSAKQESGIKSMNNVLDSILLAIKNKDLDKLKTFGIDLQTIQN